MEGDHIWGKLGQKARLLGRNEKLAIWGGENKKGGIGFVK